MSTCNIRKFQPSTYRVLVRLIPIERNKEVKSESGLIIKINSEEDLKREQEGICEAYIVDMGPTAFESEYMKSDKRYRKGDKVQIYRHAGMLVSDLNDGHTYRVVQDTDILGKFVDEEIEL